MELHEAVARRQQARAMLSEASEQYSQAADGNAAQAAVGRLQQAAALDPGFWEAHWYVGSASQHQGDYASATRSYRVALDLDPEAGGDVGSAAHLYGSLCELYLSTGNSAEAVRFYSRFLNCYPLADEVPAFARRLKHLDCCGGEWFQHYQDSIREQMANRHREAVELLRKAIALYPTAPFLLVRLALSLRALGRVDEAVRALEDASTMDPNSRTLVEMGLTYGDSGNPYVEEGCYSRALQVSPRDSLATFYRGAAAHGRGDREVALQFLERAVDLNPEAWWVEKAGKLIQELGGGAANGFPPCLREPIRWRRWTNAAHGLEVPYPEGAVERPGSGDGELAVIADRENDPQFTVSISARAALEDFAPEPFIRQREQSFARTEDLKIQFRDWLTVSGLPAFMCELRDPRQDTIRLHLFVFRQDETAEVVCRVSWALFQRARDVFRHMLTGVSMRSMTELLRAMKESSKQLLARNPRDLDALAALGKAHVELGELESAQTVYQQILTIDPNHPGALGDMGLTYWKQNKVDLAIKSLTPAIEANPDPRLVTVLGMAWLQKKKGDRTARLCESWLAQREDPNVRMLLGTAYESMRKYDAAEREFRRALEFETAKFRALMRLGTLYRDRKRYRDAITQFREAAEVDPKSSEAYLMLGVCYFEEKYWDQAEKALLKGLQFDPDSPALRDALETMRRERKKLR